jgi:purine-binding chemotaxis protein CheW
MNSADVMKVVTFRLGDDLFAADIADVERVLRYQPPTSIPDLPDWMEGVIEYQKRVVPVIDLRRRFDLPPADQRDTARIIVCNAKGEWIAAIVDAVLEVTSLDPATVAPPPPLFRGLAGEYVRGIVRRKDRLIIFLDVARLLTTSERLALSRASDETSEP